jgi:glutathione S-transferase
VLDGALELEERSSSADVSYAAHLSLAREAGASLSATPRVEAWLARMLERPAWHKTAEMIFPDE